MKIELHLKLKQDIILSFQHLKQWNYLEALKIKKKEKKKKNENGGNVPHLEITEVVLVHCSIVNNDYKQDSRVLYTFDPNKSFDSLLKISPKNYIFLKTVNSEVQAIKICSADQNSQPLEI